LTAWDSVKVKSVLDHLDFKSVLTSASYLHNRLKSSVFFKMKIILKGQASPVLYIWLTWDSVTRQVIVGVLKLERRALGCHTPVGREAEGMAAKGVAVEEEGMMESACGAEAKNTLEDSQSDTAMPAIKPKRNSTNTPRAGRLTRCFMGGLERRGAGGREEISYTYVQDGNTTN
jgi:hypothetical protein